MQAIEIPNPDGELTLVERPVPDPGPEAVRIDVDACGICHGDTAVTDGRPVIDYPRIPGHEVAGRVDAVGSAVVQWEPGDRVAVGWHGGHCLDCPPCRRGDFVNCVEEQITGIHADGGYAEFMTAPAEALASVPKSLDLVSVAPLVCAGLTAYTALTGADATAGDRVAVLGIGGVGHMGLQFADAMGFETVAVSGGNEKRGQALDLGADEFVDADATDPADALADFGGADVVLATAPSSEAIESTLDGLAPNGELLVVGAPDDPVSLEVPPLLANRLSVRGWSAGHAGDAEDALAAAARNGVEPWVETYSLDEAAQGFDRMLAGDARFRGVLQP